MKQEIITAVSRAADEVGIPYPPKLREIKNSWDRDVSPAQLREALEELREELQGRLEAAESALGAALEEKEALEALAKEFLS